jgi:hypothetical protein
LTYRKRNPRTGANRRKRFNNSEKVAMLHVRHLTVLEYDIRQILDDLELDEKTTNAFMANLITKGSRGSLLEAKEYVKDLTDEGVLTKDVSDRILALLDRNRKYR